MVKRKHETRQDHHVKRQSKKPKIEATDLSVYSELDPGYEERFEVYPPPPKLGVNTAKFVTFPMGKGKPSLPVCEGPRMGPFADGDVKVRFIRELGDNAVHSNVFEVVIAGKPYALKLFRTFSKGWLPDQSDWGDDASFPGREELMKYFKPFNRECRAYARIKERRSEERYWKCYGYLRLPNHLRQDLYDATGLPGHYWQVRDIYDRPDKATDTYPRQLQWSIYGLVKELAPAEAPPVNPKSRAIRSMFSDLKHLHKIGITNEDIADRNYISGRLIDFSSSATVPYIWFENPNEKRNAFWTWDFLAGAERDINYLRQMIIDSGVKTKVVQEDPTSEPNASRTRHGRQAISKFRGYWLPLYELGVREPSPEPVYRSSASCESRGSYGNPPPPLWPRLPYESPVAPAKRQNRDKK